MRGFALCSFFIILFSPKMEITSLLFSAMKTRFQTAQKNACAVQYVLLDRTVARNSWYCWLSRFLLLKFKCNAQHLTLGLATNKLLVCYILSPHRKIFNFRRFWILLGRRLSSILLAVSDTVTLSSNWNVSTYLHYLATVTCTDLATHSKSTNLLPCPKKNHPWNS